MRSCLFQVLNVCWSNCQLVRSQCRSHFFFSSSLLSSGGLEPVCEAREPMALRMASLFGSTPGRFSKTLCRNSGSCMS
uniref:Uncharacterized protein n=1 Tax=Anguilla anguilla TaxID=7936 RepID=A0A0E9QFV5_ANGAN